MVDLFLKDYHKNSLVKDLLVQSIASLLVYIYASPPKLQLFNANVHVWSKTYSSNKASKKARGNGT